MKRIEQSAAAVYQRLLGFYPPAFRAAFEDEMQEVFAQQAAEAAGEGPIHVAFICLRELKDYPLNLLREYWSAIQNKEVVMVTSNSSSLSASVCPRCGELRSVEARYCPNCGRAFIPLPALVVEQMRNFFNSRITLITFGAFALVFASINAEWQIVYEVFYPRSYLILVLGLGAASFLIGWLLDRARSNSKRLGLILFSLIAVMLFYTGVEMMDNSFILSAIKTGQPVTYQFLGLTTRLERLEAGASMPDFPLFQFNQPVCDENNWSCLQSFTWIEKEANQPVVVVERSWNLPVTVH